MEFEVEQKFQVDDWSEIAQTLRSMGVTFDQPMVQVDNYFDHPARSFAQTDEALRIRRAGGKCLVTYKGPKIDAESKTRQEIELALGEGQEECSKFEQLLGALGFVSVATVRKSRLRASLQWEGRTGEIALDDVEGLGYFVELDFVATRDQLPQARHCLLSLAQRLGLSHDERRSYLELLLERHTE